MKKKLTDRFQELTGKIAQVVKHDGHNSQRIIAKTVIDQGFQHDRESQNFTVFSVLNRILYLCNFLKPL